MSNTEIEDVAAAYAAACEGDVSQALRAAVADLIETHRDAEQRLRAMDQWVSRGYVQGRASDVYLRRAGGCAISTP